MKSAASNGSWARPSLNWLLVFVPAAVLLEHFRPDADILIFFASALAIVPLAGWLGRATEHLAERTGQGLGGLLNATFGNAAELVIALVALRSGLRDVVKASLTGSILGNLLLVLGGAALAGGLRYKEQRFNPLAARVQATMLTLAAIALIIPAGYHRIVRPTTGNESLLSTTISVVLLATYALSLVFSLHTHRQLFLGQPDAPAEHASAPPRWSARKAVLVLAGTTILVAWMSEILVGSITGAAQGLGMTSVFVGVIVVGIAGNAAEHSTAILVARDNKMDLAVAIAIGSSIQVALFVAPVLVLASHVIGPRPMDLVFTAPEVIAIALSVWITGQIAGDGESNWLEGVQLLAVYFVMAITFYLLPGG